MFPMSSPEVALFFSLFLVSLSAAGAFNITQFLNLYPEFTILNNYLIQAGLVDQINSLPSVTVLVVANDNMTALSGRSPDEMKKLLSVHVILGYYDPRKLHDLPEGRITLPTLYQKIGQEGNLIAYSLGRHSPVAFGDDPNHNSILLKPLLSRPNATSVLQVTNIIRLSSNSTSSAPTKAPTFAAYNITQSITFPDLTTFSSYLTQTGIADQIYKISSQQAITVLFVGNDNMTALSGQSLVAIKKVLSVHVILGYYDAEKLKALPDGTITLPTLAQQSGQEGNLTAYSLGRNSPVAFGDGPNHNSVLLKSLDKHPNTISVLQVSNIISLSSNSTSSAPANAPAASPSSNAPVKAPTASPSSNAPVKAPAASPSSNSTAPSARLNSTAPSSPGASPPRKALAPGPSSKKSPAASSPNSSTPTATSADTPSGSAADGPGYGKSSAVSVTSGYHLVSILMVFTSPLFLLIMI